jgi:hypothetical protein
MSLINMSQKRCLETSEDTTKAESLPGDRHACLFACTASAFASAATPAVHSFFAQWSAMRSKADVMNHSTGAEKMF